MWMLIVWFYMGPNIPYYPQSYYFTSEKACEKSLKEHKSYSRAGRIFVVDAVCIPVGETRLDNY